MLNRTALLATICTICTICTAFTTACGGGGGGGGTADAQIPPPDAPPSHGALLSLTIQPPDVVYRIDDGAAVTRQYRVYGRYEDDAVVDLTTDAAWVSFDPALLSIDAAGVATTSGQLGGATMIQATLGGVVAATGATVIQRHLDPLTGAPTDVAARFDAAQLDPTFGRAPALMYPESGTVLPPNFPGLEFQFLRGQGNDLYELALIGGFYELHTYGACAPAGVGCALKPTAAAWTFIGEHFLGQDVDVVVSALAAATPDTKGVSSARTLSFTSEELTAGLYYWAATTGQIHRFDFGHADAPPEIWYPTGAGGDCAACHALSRDGTLAAIVRGAGQLELLDVATKTVNWSIPAPFVNSSFSPDNTKLIVAGSSATGPSALTVFDVATGIDLALGLTDTSASTPDWSPDGSMIVYAQNQLTVRSWDGAAFGPAATLVPATSERMPRNPAFTPDSEWVVFDAMASDGASLTLWTQDIAGTAPPRLLSAANGGYATNTWPKLAPRLYGYKGGKVAFVSFSSLRPIGLRSGAINQIWLTAFDPDRAALGLDPTFPAVHLPWQDTFAGNHIAQWADDIPHEPCGPMGECPTGEFCEDGECVPIID